MKKKRTEKDPFDEIQNYRFPVLYAPDHMTDEHHQELSKIIREYKKKNGEENYLLKVPQLDDLQDVRFPVISAFLPRTQRELDEISAYIRAHKTRVKRKERKKKLSKV